MTAPADVAAGGADPTPSASPAPRPGDEPDPPPPREPTHSLGRWWSVLRRVAGDRRARRWALVMVPGMWLVLSLAAGGGLVQYAPGGWTVPVRTWIIRWQPTPYGFYALTDHWAVVPVPAYLARALGVALLAGLYVALVVVARGWAPSGEEPSATTTGGARTVGTTGLAVGILGAAACCSPLALGLAGLLGATAAAWLTGLGLWAAAAVFAVGALWQLRRLDTAGS